MASRRIIQGGSTLTFALIGVALAVVVVGLLFWANQRSQQTNQPTAPLGTNQGTDQAQTGSATEGAKPDANKTDDGATNTTGSTSGEQGAGNTQSPAAGAGAADGMTSGGAAQNGQVGAGNDNAVAQLPQTGPADTLVSVVAVALLVGGTVAYLRSRAYVQSQLS